MALPNLRRGFDRLSVVFGASWLAYLGLFGPFLEARRLQHAASSAPDVGLSDAFLANATVYRQWALIGHDFSLSPVYTTLAVVGPPIAFWLVAKVLALTLGWLIEGFQTK